MYHTKTPSSPRFPSGETRFINRHQHSNTTLGSVFAHEKEKSPFSGEILAPSVVSGAALSAALASPHSAAVTSSNKRGPRATTTTIGTIKESVLIDSTVSSTAATSGVRNLTEETATLFSSLLLPSSQAVTGLNSGEPSSSTTTLRREEKSTILRPRLPRSPHLERVRDQSFFDSISVPMGKLSPGKVLHVNGGPSRSSSNRRQHRRHRALAEDSTQSKRRDSEADNLSLSRERRHGSPYFFSSSNKAKGNFSSLLVADASEHNHTYYSKQDHEYELALFRDRLAALFKQRLAVHRDKMVRKVMLRQGLGEKVRTAIESDELFALRSACVCAGNVSGGLALTDQTLIAASEDARGTEVSAVERQPQDRRSLVDNDEFFATDSYENPYTACPDLLFVGESSKDGSRKKNGSSEQFTAGGERRGGIETKASTRIDDETIQKQAGKVDMILNSSVEESSLAALLATSVFGPQTVEHQNEEETRQTTTACTTASATENTVARQNKPTISGTMAALAKLLEAHCSLETNVTYHNMLRNENTAGKNIGAGVAHQGQQGKGTPIRDEAYNTSVENNLVSSSNGSQNPNNTNTGTSTKMHMMSAAYEGAEGMTLFARSPRRSLDLHQQPTLSADVRQTHSPHHEQQLKPNDQGGDRQRRRVDAALEVGGNNGASSPLPSATATRAVATTTLIPKKWSPRDALTQQAAERAVAVVLGRRNTLLHQQNDDNNSSTPPPRRSVLAIVGVRAQLSEEEFVDGSSNPTYPAHQENRLNRNGVADATPEPLLADNRDAVDLNAQREDSEFEKKAGGAADNEGISMQKPHNREKSLVVGPFLLESLNVILRQHKQWAALNRGTEKREEEKERSPSASTSYSSSYEYEEEDEDDDHEEDAENSSEDSVTTSPPPQPRRSPKGLVSTSRTVALALKNSIGDDKEEFMYREEKKNETQQRPLNDCTNARRTHASVTTAHNNNNKNNNNGQPSRDPAPLSPFPPKRGNEERSSLKSLESSERNGRGGGGRSNNELTTAADGEKRSLLQSETSQKNVPIVSRSSNRRGLLLFTDANVDDLDSDKRERGGSVGSDSNFSRQPSKKRGSNRPSLRSLRSQTRDTSLRSSRAASSILLTSSLMTLNSDEDPSGKENEAGDEENLLDQSTHQDHDTATTTLGGVMMDRKRKGQRSRRTKGYPQAHQGGDGSSLQFHPVMFGDRSELIESKTEEKSRSDDDDYGREAVASSATLPFIRPPPSQQSTIGSAKGSLSEADTNKRSNSVHALPPPPRPFLPQLSAGNQQLATEETQMAATSRSPAAATSPSSIFRRIRPDVNDSPALLSSTNPLVKTNDFQRRVAADGALSSNIFSPRPPQTKDGHVDDSAASPKAKVLQQPSSRPLLSVGAVGKLSRTLGEASESKKAATPVASPATPPMSRSENNNNSNRNNVRGATSAAVGVSVGATETTDPRTVNLHINANIFSSAAAAGGRERRVARLEGVNSDQRITSTSINTPNITSTDAKNASFANNVTNSGVLNPSGAAPKAKTKKDETLQQVIADIDGKRLEHKKASRELTISIRQAIRNIQTVYAELMVSKDKQRQQFEVARGQCMLLDRHAAEAAEVNVGLLRVAANGFEALKSSLLLLQENGSSVPVGTTKSSGNFSQQKETSSSALSVSDYSSMSLSSVIRLREELEVVTLRSEFLMKPQTEAESEEGEEAGGVGEGNFPNLKNDDGGEFERVEGLSLTATPSPTVRDVTVAGKQNTPSAASSPASSAHNIVELKRVVSPAANFFVRSPVSLLSSENASSPTVETAVRDFPSPPAALSKSTAVSKMKMSEEALRSNLALAVLIGKEVSGFCDEYLETVISTAQEKRNENQIMIINTKEVGSGGAAESIRGAPAQDGTSASPSSSNQLTNGVGNASNLKPTESPLGSSTNSGSIKKSSETRPKYLLSLAASSTQQQEHQEQHPEQQEEQKEFPALVDDSEEVISRVVSTLHNEFKADATLLYKASLSAAGHQQKSNQKSKEGAANGSNSRIRNLNNNSAIKRSASAESTSSYGGLGGGDSNSSTSHTSPSLSPLSTPASKTMSFVHGGGGGRDLASAHSYHLTIGNTNNNSSSLTRSLSRSPSASASYLSASGVSSASRTPLLFGGGGGGGGGHFFIDGDDHDNNHNYSSSSSTKNRSSPPAKKHNAHLPTADELSDPLEFSAGGRTRLPNPNPNPNSPYNKSSHSTERLIGGVNGGGGASPLTGALLASGNGKDSVPKRKSATNNVVGSHQSEEDRLMAVGEDLDSILEELAASASAATLKTALTSSATSADSAYSSVGQGKSVIRSTTRKKNTNSRSPSSPTRHGVFEAVKKEMVNMSEKWEDTEGIQSVEVLPSLLAMKSKPKKSKNRKRSENEKGKPKKESPTSASVVSIGLVNTPTRSSSDGAPVDEKTYYDTQTKTLPLGVSAAQFKAKKIKEEEQEGEHNEDTQEETQSADLDKEEEEEEEEEKSVAGGGGGGATETLIKKSSGLGTLTKATLSPSVVGPTTVHVPTPPPPQLRATDSSTNSSMMRKSNSNKRNKNITTAAATHQGASSLSPPRATAQPPYRRVKEQQQQQQKQQQQQTLPLKSVLKKPCLSLSVGDLTQSTDPEPLAQKTISPTRSTPSHEESKRETKNRSAVRRGEGGGDIRGEKGKKSKSEDPSPTSSQHEALQVVAPVVRFSKSALVDHICPDTVDDNDDQGPAVITTRNARSSVSTTPVRNNSNSNINTNNNNNNTIAYFGGASSSPSLTAVGGAFPSQSTINSSQLKKKLSDDGERNVLLSSSPSLTKDTADDRRTSLGFFQYTTGQHKNSVSVNNSNNNNHKSVNSMMNSYNGSATALTNTSLNNNKNNNSFVNTNNSNASFSIFGGSNSVINAGTSSKLWGREASVSVGGGGGEGRSVYSVGTATTLATVSMIKELSIGGQKADEYLKRLSVVGSGRPATREGPLRQHHSSSPSSRTATMLPPYSIVRRTIDMGNIAQVKEILTAELDSLRQALLEDQRKLEEKARRKNKLFTSGDIMSQLRYAIFEDDEDDDDEFVDSEVEADDHDDGEENNEDNMNNDVTTDEEDDAEEVSCEEEENQKQEYAHRAGAKSNAINTLGLKRPKRRSKKGQKAAKAKYSVKSTTTPHQQKGEEKKNLRVGTKAAAVRLTDVDRFRIRQSIERSEQLLGELSNLESLLSRTIAEKTSITDDLKAQIEGEIVDCETVMIRTNAELRKAKMARKDLVKRYWEWRKSREIGDWRAGPTFYDDLQQGPKRKDVGIQSEIQLDTLPGHLRRFVKLMRREGDLSSRLILLELKLAEIDSVTQRIHSELLCPLCHQLLNHPVLLRPCGHAYCQRCFEHSLDLRVFPNDPSIIQCRVCSIVVTEPATLTDLLLPEVCAKFSVNLVGYKSVPQCVRAVKVALSKVQERSVKRSMSAASAAMLVQHMTDEGFSEGVLNKPAVKYGENK